MGGRPLDLQILSLVLGILGNVIQILVFASPLYVIIVSSALCPPHLC
jgi:hypothetical protein